MFVPEQCNLLEAVRSTHRKLSMLTLESLGVPVKEWNPNSIIEEHGETLGVISTHVTYSAQRILLPSPLFTQTHLQLKESYASLDLGAERYTKGSKLNKNYGSSVKFLVREVECPVFILNLSKMATRHTVEKDFATIFLMSDAPPFAVHEDDLQHTWDQNEQALDIKLLPKLDALFEGDSQVQLSPEQCSAIITAISTSSPRFTTEDDYPDL